MIQLVEKKDNGIQPVTSCLGQLTGVEACPEWRVRVSNDEYFKRLAEPSLTFFLASRAEKGCFGLLALFRNLAGTSENAHLGVPRNRQIK